VPARSEAQRRYLYAKFGAAWVRRHHFDTKGKLPARVKPKHPNSAQARKGGRVLRDASRKR
jgi:hypothetical protein